MFKEKKVEKIVEVNIEYCPTRSGNYTAYMPEWLDGGKWKEIPVRAAKHSEYYLGVPASRRDLGTNYSIGLYSYAQAQALAWGFAAEIEAETFSEIQVRLQPYQVIYDIKAHKIDIESVSPQRKDA